MRPGTNSIKKDTLAVGGHNVKVIINKTAETQFIWACRGSAFVLIPNNAVETWIE